MQTLSDLIGNFQLYAVCVPCRRMVKLELPELRKKLGAATPLSHVRQRVRCRNCHMRTRDIRIVYVGPCGAAAGFHYRR